MRCIKCVGVGLGATLEIGEDRVPRPIRDEVLVRVSAAGINHLDVLQRIGMALSPPGSTSMLGIEIAGTVVTVGETVKEFQIGDRVCAPVIGGGYAEYATVPATHCLPVPASVPLDHAAALPNDLFVLWAALYQHGSLPPGRKVLVHGGSTGLGSLAIQFLKRDRISVVATANGSDGVALVEKLGADITIDFQTESYDALIARLGVEKFDVVFDTVGCPMDAPMMRATQGPAEKIGHKTVRQVQLGSGVELLPGWDFLPRTVKRINMAGVTVRSVSVETKGVMAAGIRKALWPAIERGEVKPVVHGAALLQQAMSAHRLVQAGGTKGNLVLTLRSA